MDLGSCKKFGGGPMMVKDDGHWIQIGVLPGGYFCDISGKYSLLSLKMIINHNQGYYYSNCIFYLIVTIENIKH